MISYRCNFLHVIKTMKENPFSQNPKNIYLNITYGVSRIKLACFQVQGLFRLIVLIKSLSPALLLLNPIDPSLLFSIGAPFSLFFLFLKVRCPDLGWTYREIEREGIERENDCYGRRERMVGGRGNFAVKFYF